MKEESMPNESGQIIEWAIDIERAIDALEKLNAPTSPLRSRQLSLAITKLQEASHWLADYLAEQ
jgi:hypothetical protein